VKNKVKVTIGSDDPGIFDTNLQKEYSKAKEMGLSVEEIETIRTKSFLYTSSLLSGRTKSS
jgi:adenosine deaminase